ncbi:MAG: UDP-N-acetylglucosamine 2-epimerase (non-hydrolyzing) [Tissierellia bacterium]|nr:UDP-N-acetylglucosamine 2-epimerase (non-hydrolyzing) [Tissierellia bacterium]
MKVLTVFGTRPEAIKLAPIIKEMEKRDNIESVICVTGQHREMLDQVLAIFEIEPDYDLNIFQSGQSLTDITIRSMKGIEDVIKKEEPDLLLVQGDTSTVFTAALTAFYNGVKIGHVEAGLRSGNIFSPFPEEANRQLTGIVTSLHFAPTVNNKENLLKENYDADQIFITGNTVIDALGYTVTDSFEFNDKALNSIDFENNKVILLTSHRRENLGEPMKNVFSAINDVVNANDNVKVVFPMHLNPKVRELARKEFEGNENIILIEPLEYLEFSNLMSKCYFIVTDSGGIQEEAPSLEKPVLVIREETERQEGIEAGTAKLIGTKYDDVFASVNELLNDENEYSKMASSVNPYGDGKASERIVDIIVEKLK